MKKGWLSVIIPAYNTGKWVRGQLNQLKAQMPEYPNVEIIVVDDGGSEDMGWVKDYPNAVLKRKRNGGAAFPSQLEWKIGLAWANTRGSLNSPS